VFIIVIVIVVVVVVFISLSTQSGNFWIHPHICSHLVSGSARKNRNVNI